MRKQFRKTIILTIGSLAMWIGIGMLAFIQAGIYVI